MTYDPHSYLRENPGKRWLFRWGFTFNDGRPTRYGSWTPPASFQDTCKAVEGPYGQAFIQGKHFLTKEIKTFAIADGDEYEVFKRLEIFYGNDQGGHVHCYGMDLVCKDFIIRATEDGRVEHVPRA